MEPIKLTYSFEVVFDLDALRARHPDDDRFVEAVKESVAEFIEQHRAFIHNHPLVGGLNERSHGQ